MLIVFRLWAQGRLFLTLMLLMRSCCEESFPRINAGCVKQLIPSSEKTPEESDDYICPLDYSGVFDIPGCGYSPVSLLGLPPGTRKFAIVRHSSLLVLSGVEHFLDIPCYSCSEVRMLLFLRIIAVSASYIGIIGGVETVLTRNNREFLEINV